MRIEDADSPNRMVAPNGDVFFPDDLAEARYFAEHYDAEFTHPKQFPIKEPSMTYPPHDPNQPPLLPPGYWPPPQQPYHHQPQPAPPQIVMVRVARPFPWYWHLLHLTGTVFTCGLWGIVYAIHYGAHKKANQPNPYHY